MQKESLSEMLLENLTIKIQDFAHTFVSNLNRFQYERCKKCFALCIQLLELSSFLIFDLNILGTAVAS